MPALSKPEPVEVDSSSIVMKAPVLLERTNLPSVFTSALITPPVSLLMLFTSSVIDDDAEIVNVVS